MNGTTADDASHITEVVNEISTQSELISDSLALFMEFSDLYVQSNQNIAGIANQTNLLSLNASIEAARVGESDSIRVLSDEIKVTVSEI